MVPQTLFVAFLLLNGFAAARTCTNLTIPVDISSRQGLFRQLPVESNLDITAFSQEFTKLGGNYSKTLLEGYQTLIGCYNISAKYCQPDAGPSSTIQLLSHGIGFDKTYWDLSFNNYNYSYVETAVAQGYSTLAIDRFGIGNSSHGDPLNVVQAQAEIEAMNAITTKLRHGTVEGIAHKFSKIVHVGHSFGSVQSYWLSALYPNNTDGIVLTGWSGNGTFLPTTVAAWNLHNARLNQPLRFGNASNAGILGSFGSMGSTIVQGVQSALKAVGVQLSSQDVYDDIATTGVANLITGWNQTVTSLNYPSGYTTHSDFTANQFVFLQYGRYDPTLGLLTEATKHSVTVGEILTIGNAPAKTSFSGPVLVITGEHDQPFCGGDCYATGGVASNIPAVAAPQFPNASPFETYIQPETAHGINAHYNSTGAYKVIQSFLGAHGLAA